MLKLRAYYWQPLPESRIVKYFEVRDKLIQQGAHEDEEAKSLPADGASVNAGHMFDPYDLPSSLNDDRLMFNPESQ